MIRVMVVVLAFMVATALVVGCATPQVRSTVDSFGEIPLSRSAKHYFVKPESLLDSQAIESCEAAAVQAQIPISEKECKDCIAIQLRTRLAGTQQVVRSSPGWGTSWGIFGGGYGGLGVGYGTGASVSSHEEAGREIGLLVYTNSDFKKPAREIQVRSVGRQNSVSAVAFEMCQAAFADYPQNLQGKFYEIDVKDEQKKN